MLKYRAVATHVRNFQRFRQLEKTFTFNEKKVVKCLVLSKKAVHLQNHLQGMGLTN